MKEEIKTKFSENRFKTSNTAEMLGMYTAERVLREYEDEFVDKNTGEVVPCHRCEVLVERGTLIDKELLAEISFYLQSGEIEGVIVSNQRRMAEERTEPIRMFSCSAISNGKKKRIMLYARGVDMCIDIARDYMELNTAGEFSILEVKANDVDFYIEDERKNSEYASALLFKYYKIDFEVNRSGYELIRSAIVYTTDMDKAIEIVGEHVHGLYKGDDRSDEVDIKVITLSGREVGLDEFVGRAFSDAYCSGENS